MSAPPFVADFDSATALVRALAAALADEPFRRLDRSRVMAGVVRASRALPEAARQAVFSRSGGFEAIRPVDLPTVQPERFCRWVTRQYPVAHADAVAIGSSNGAVMHLCAATGIPWLPQTFLVPVRRRADPDDCQTDMRLATAESARLLAQQPGLQIHQMHDPNQDRLMVRHIAYFRLKMRTLTDAYRAYLRRTLAPGGTILIVDTRLRWPATRRGQRHVYQQGAVGGLAPQEYVDGSPRVARFLADQRSGARRWRFPPVDEWAPEAEWGYEPSLTDDLRGFAAQNGYRVARLRLDSPDAAGPVVAEVLRDWYAATGSPANRLLVETFICTEPTWCLATRTVPLWLSFGTEPALDEAVKYLSGAERFEQIGVTLFPHGVRSAGYAAAEQWLQAAHDHAPEAMLAGVEATKWPADFASLATYADALHSWVPDGKRRCPLPIDDAAEAVTRLGASRDVTWTWE